MLLHASFLVTEWSHHADGEVLKLAQQVTGYELKEYQQQAIEAFLCGKDDFVSAPTGAGKSLAFELAPFHFLDYRLVLVGTISTNDVCGQFRYELPSGKDFQV